MPDGFKDAHDFFYLDAFAGGNLDIVDLTGSNDPDDPNSGVPDGNLDGQDFFFYLDLPVRNKVRRLKTLYPRGKPPGWAANESCIASVRWIG